MQRYTVVFDDDFVSFEKEVNDNLKNGWKCQGGIAVAGSYDDTWYHQAMIKEAAE